MITTGFSFIHSWMNYISRNKNRFLIHPHTHTHTNHHHIAIFHSGFLLEKKIQLWIKRPTDQINNRLGFFLNKKKRTWGKQVLSSSSLKQQILFIIFLLFICFNIFFIIKKYIKIIRRWEFSETTTTIIVIAFTVYINNDNKRQRR